MAFVKYILAIVNGRRQYEPFPDTSAFVAKEPGKSLVSDTEITRLANMTGGALTPEQIAAIAAQVPPSGVTIEQIKADIDIADSLSKKHSIQDLSGLQPKESSRGLSTNDYTTEEKNKLAGISGGLTQSQILTRQL